MSSKDFSEYDKRFVFFIDILGFKDLVEKSSKPKDIKQIIDLLKEDFIVANKKYDLQLAITPVSDCIILSFKNEAKFILHFILYIISYVQANAIAKYGLLFRGAGTFGDMIHNEEYQFGRAYQHAYHLETEFAIYPRVILEKKLINSLNNEEKESCLELLKEDGDFYYIDFINNELISDESPDNKRDFFNKCKKIIEKRIVHAEKNLKKYYWLRDCFNETIQVFNKDIDINLRIDEIKKGL